MSKRKTPPPPHARPKAPPFDGWVAELTRCMDGEWYSVATFQSRTQADLVRRKLENGDYACPGVRSKWEFQAVSKVTEKVSDTYYRGTSELFARYKGNASKQRQS